MRNKFNTAEQCLQMEEMILYLDHGLDPDQERLVDLHLAQCKLCTGALQMMEEENKSSGLGHVHATQLEREFKTAIRKAQPQTGPPRTVPAWMKYAAMILLLLIPAYLIYNNYSTDTNSNLRLYAAYFEPYEDILSLRGTPEDNNGNISEAMELYNAGNYKDAAFLFNVVLSKDPENQIIKLYAGISLMQLSREQEAIDHFNQLINKGGLLSEQALWYKSLALVRSGDKDEAKVPLQSLAYTEGIYQEKAAKLLTDL